MSVLDAVGRQSFAVLDQDGVFVRFTYGPADPVRRSIAEESGITGRRSGWVLRNLLPAALWRYRHGNA